MSSTPPDSTAQCAGITTCAARGRRSADTCNRPRLARRSAVAPPRVPEGVAGASTQVPEEALPSDDDDAGGCADMSALDRVAFDYGAAGDGDRAWQGLAGHAAPHVVHVDVDVDVDVGKEKVSHGRRMPRRKGCQPQGSRQPSAPGPSQSPYSHLEGQGDPIAAGNSSRDSRADAGGAQHAWNGARRVGGHQAGAGATSGRVAGGLEGRASSSSDAGEVEGEAPEGKLVLELDPEEELGDGPGAAHACGSPADGAGEQSAQQQHRFQQQRGQRPRKARSLYHGLRPMKKLASSPPAKSSQQQAAMIPQALQLQQRLCPDQHDHHQLLQDTPHGGLHHQQHQQQQPHVGGPTGHGHWQQQHTYRSPSPEAAAEYGLPQHGQPDGHGVVYRTAMTQADQTAANDIISVIDDDEEGYDGNPDRYGAAKAGPGAAQVDEVANDIKHLRVTPPKAFTRRRGRGAVPLETLRSGNDRDAMAGIAGEGGGGYRGKNSGGVGAAVEATAAMQVGAGGRREEEGRAGFNDGAGSPYRGRINQHLQDENGQQQWHQAASVNPMLLSTPAAARLDENAQAAATRAAAQLASCIRSGGKVVGNWREAGLELLQGQHHQDSLPAALFSGEGRDLFHPSLCDPCAGGDSRGREGGSGQTAGAELPGQPSIDASSRAERQQPHPHLLHQQKGRQEKATRAWTMTQDVVSLVSDADDDGSGTRGRGRGGRHVNSAAARGPSAGAGRASGPQGSASRRLAASMDLQDTCSPSEAAAAAAGGGERRTRARSSVH